MKGQEWLRLTLPTFLWTISKKIIIIYALKIKYDGFGSVEA